MGAEGQDDVERVGQILRSGLVSVSPSEKELHLFRV
jgi:hypothetical protein